MMEPAAADRANKQNVDSAEQAIPTNVQVGKFCAPHFAAQFFAPELRAWRGQQPLWKVFWLYGVATSSALIAVYAVAFFVDRVALRQILVVCFAPYTALILVSVWRCANNSRVQIWGLLARFLTIAWALNTILIVVFVEMNLITHYYLNY